MLGIATCHFYGTLTEKPKLYEGDGKGGYTYFELAINYPGTRDKDGTFKPGNVEFPRFSANGYDAKFICNHGEKGDAVYVETDIRTTSRSVEKDGKTTVYNDTLFPVIRGKIRLYNSVKPAQSNTSGEPINAAPTPVEPVATQPENEGETPALTEMEQQAEMALGEGGLPF